MTATIILAVLLGMYTLWVVRRKIKDMKNGKFCSCGCESCTGSCGKKGGSDL